MHVVEATPEDFLSKIFKPLTQFQFEVHHIIDFYQSQMLYHVIYYQKLFF